MTTLFTDAGKAIDSACDAVYDTVASWFADEKPEPGINVAQLQAMMEIMTQLVAMQAQQKSEPPPQA